MDFPQNASLAKWNGIYAHTCGMGGSRYLLINVDTSFGSYTRVPIFIFTVTGSVARCVLVALMTANGTLSASQTLLGGTAFNAMSVGYWSGTKAYVKIDISGYGTYDYVTVITHADFTFQTSSS